MIHVKAALKVAAASGLLGALAVQVGVVAAGIEHTLVDEILAGLVIGILGGGLKVWSDQRSDQRAWRHYQLNQKQATESSEKVRADIDSEFRGRLQHLESRTEVAIRLESEVGNLSTNMTELARTAEELRRLNTENHGVLQYLKGRADQTDADIRRRRQSDS